MVRVTPVPRGLGTRGERTRHVGVGRMDKMAKVVLNGRICGGGRITSVEVGPM